MNRSGNFSTPLMWFVELLVIAAVAGCGGGGGDAGNAPVAQAGAGVPTNPGAGNGTGDPGHGPAPIDLQTAANFVILGETAITNVPTSAVNGNVGLGPASSGANIALSCAEVTGGAIYTADSAGPTGPPGCRQRNAATVLTNAVADGHGAWNDGRVRVPDYTDVRGGNIGGTVLPPATYKWSTGVRISADVTLKGGPKDVWIFLIEQDLNLDPGVRIILDGALPQNVYWLTLVQGVELGAGSHFEGIILAETSIFARTGASINGRLLAAQSINLDANTVTQP